MAAIPKYALWLPVTLVLGAIACDGPPARSKPWRHAPTPTGDGVPSAISHVLTAEKERVEAQKNRGHTLRIHMNARPVHLNPMSRATEWGLRIAFDTVYESLIRYRPPAGGVGAGPGTYEPSLARSWTLSPDAREIRLAIQPQARFHDGRRVTAVDVQFSIDSARHPRTDAPHFRSALADVTSVEILSSSTVRVRLARSNAYVMRALAEIPILPEHVYERTINQQAGPTIGSGPYKVESVSADRVHLKRWDDYWGDTPAIPEIVFAYEPDGAAALTAAKRGEIDIVPELIPSHYPEQAEAPGMDGRFAPLRLRPATMEYLVLNTSVAPLDDLNIRRALNLLVDRKTLVGKYHRGLARAAPGPIWPGGPGDGAAPAAPSFDELAAADLLDRAGFRRDGSGVRRRASERLAIDVLVSDEDRPDRDAILAGFRKAGIATDIRVGTPAVLANRLREGEFGAAFVEWRGGTDRDLTPLLATGGKLNYGRFSDRGVDMMLSQARLSWEPAARSKVFRELAADFGRHWPIIPLTSPDPYGLVDRRVQGVVVWNGWLSLRDLSLSSETE